MSARLGAAPAPRRPGAGAPLPLAPHRPAAAHAPGEPFQPERTFHKGRARQGLVFGGLALLGEQHKALLPAAGAQLDSTRTVGPLRPEPRDAALLHSSTHALGALPASCCACRRGGGARGASRGAGGHLQRHLL